MSSRARAVVAGNDRNVTQTGSGRSTGYVGHDVDGTLTIEMPTPNFADSAIPLACPAPA